MYVRINIRNLIEEHGVKVTCITPSILSISSSYGTTNMGYYEFVYYYGVVEVALSTSKKMVRWGTVVMSVLVYSVEMVPISSFLLFFFAGGELTT